MNQKILLRKELMKSCEEKEKRVRKIVEKEKDERIKNYNLEEISKLFNLLGESSNIKKLIVDNVVFGNKTYSLKKGKDDLFIICSDERCLKLKMKFVSWRESDGYFSEYTVKKSTAIFEYALSNNTFLEFSSSISSSIDYGSFKKLDVESLERESELKCEIPSKNLSIKFWGDFNHLQAFCPKIGDRQFNFTPTEIIYCNDYSISNDGKSILYIRGKKVLSLEEAKDFNAAEEKLKFQKLLENDKTLHPYTKELLEKTMKNFDKKEEEVYKLLKFYTEDIPFCKDVVDARNIIISEINNYIFKKEELLFLRKVLAEAIKEKCMEIKKAEELYNSPDERAKRLVKSLSEEELSALKRRIND